MDNFMGVWDTHVAEENPEYGKRKSLVGDAVAEILELKEITAAITKASSFPPVISTKKAASIKI